MPRAAAVIDLAAAHHNLGVMAARAGDAELMAVVKAEGYGHGMVPLARVAREAGVSWLGVALPSEALELRAAGDSGRILAWLWAAGDPDISACVEADIDLSVSSLAALEEIATAARSQGHRARVHLKVDTGLSRNGVPEHDWAEVIAALASSDDLEVVGIWSHLSSADVVGSTSVAAQRAVFERAIATAESAGLTGLLRHLGNTATVLAHPDCQYDIVRVGIGIYGVSPNPEMGTAADLGLRPVMTLRVKIAGIKRIKAGASVSYGETWTAAESTLIGLIPIGYADGVPRSASNRANVSVNGRTYPIVGTVAMDQFMVDLGENPDGLVVGDNVVLFGRDGDPAEIWAEHADTIGYEVITRIAPRVPRVYES
ncbi:MAG: alanine racemase [Candidatus Nanopelagicales bacterium]